MTEENSRTSALASRHTALGSGLEDWNGMGTAWSYNSNPEHEHDAVRESVGIFDMSPLKKIWVTGRDAGKAINHTVTRDLNKIHAGQSVYTAVLTENGTMSDDAIATHISDKEWLYCHGSGGSMEQLQKSIDGLEAELVFDDDLHNIAVQGPKSLELLAAHSDASLDTLRYFQHTSANLFGHPCRISRTGYSGEKGYEIFIDKKHVLDTWDQLVGHSETLGGMPCSFAALDKVRIEAALLFYGYDMTDEHTPWEVGLGFTIDSAKEAFRGRQAVMDSKGREQFLGSGIVVNHNEALAGGETLILQGQTIGTVNSPCWSHRLGKTLALAHIQTDLAVPGTELRVQGEGVDCNAIIANIPFFDPDKTLTRA